MVERFHRWKFFLVASVLFRYLMAKLKIFAGSFFCILGLQFFLKRHYNIDQELITIIRLTTLGNVQLAVKITIYKKKKKTMQL